MGTTRITLFLSLEKTQPCSSRKLIVVSSDVQLFLKYSSIISLVGYQVKKGDRVSVCSGRVRRVFLLAIAVAIVIPPFAQHYTKFCATLCRDVREGQGRARTTDPAAGWFESAMDGSSSYFIGFSFLKSVIVCWYVFASILKYVRYSIPFAVSKTMVSMLPGGSMFCLNEYRPGCGDNA